MSFVLNLADLEQTLQFLMGKRAFRSEVKGDGVRTFTVGIIAMGTAMSQGLNDFLFVLERV